MFGESVTGEEGTETVTAGTNDAAAYGGFGFVTAEKHNGESKFVMYWLHKVKFGAPSDTISTKGENITFNTPSIEGKAIGDAAGNWRTKQYFETAAEAVEALKTKAGIAT